MVNLLADHAESYSLESFNCGHCGRDFQAKVITWIDV